MTDPTMTDPTMTDPPVADPASTDEGAGGGRARGWVAALVDRPVAVAMATSTLLLFGWISLSRLPVELLPDISYPTLTVRTEFRDAGPEEVERAVTEPIQEILATAEGIRSIRSESRPDVSEVVVELGWGASLDEASQRVRERIDLLRLDDGVDRPQLLRYDPALDPILQIAFPLSATVSPAAATTATAPSMSAAAATSVESGEAIDDTVRALAALRRHVEEHVEPVLERVVGVAMVEVEGGFETVVRVELDPVRAEQSGISAADLAAAIDAANVNLPGGRVRRGRIDYQVRTTHPLETVEDLRALPIAAPGSGRTVPLAAIATVRRAVLEPEAIARVDGQPAVVVSVFREADANVVEVGRAVKDLLAEGTESAAGGESTAAETGAASEGEPGARRELPAWARLPEGAAAPRVLSDASVFIESAIEEVQLAALYGGVLAVLVLLVFLRRLSATLVVALAIPISVLATFVPMMLAGVTLNLMSLGGLALGIGMLVDNAIVVIEAITRRREEGASARAAAIEGTSEVAGAVTASTLTTVAVFGPLVFVEGVAGQVFGDLALSVIFSLLASLAAALVVVPTWAGRSARVRLGGVPALRLRWTQSHVRAHRADGAWAPLAAGALRRAAGRLRQIIMTPYVLVSTVVLAVVEIPVRLGLLALWCAAWLAGRLAWLIGRLWPARIVDGGLGGLGAVGAGIHGAALAFSVRYRGLLFAACIAAFGWAVWQTQQLGRELLPESSQGRLRVELAVPAGTPLAALDDRARAIEAHLAELDTVANWVVRLRGPGASSGLGDSQAGASPVRFDVELKRPDASAASEQPRPDEAAVTAELLRWARDTPGMALDVGRPALVTFRDPIEVVVQGQNLERLDETARAVAAALRADPDVDAVRHSGGEGMGERQVIFRRDALARHGLQARAVAERLRSELAGEIATELRSKGERLDVWVRADRGQLIADDDLRALSIAGAGEAAVRLGQVADVVPGRGPASILGVDGARALTVSATLRPGADLGTVLTRVGPAIDSVPRFANQRVELGGQREEMEQSLSSLGFALALAVFLVFAVMASQFESLSSPLVILLTVPLAWVGVAAALWYLSVPLSVVVYLGGIVLAGIVVNNAIVLVDAAERNRRDGLDPREASVRAARSRLRPIAITAATTILGLLPMALAQGEGSEIRAPMALVIMGGLLVGTLLTLVVIPVAFESKERLLERLRRAPVGADREVG